MSYEVRYMGERFLRYPAEELDAARREAFGRLDRNPEQHLAGIFIRGTLIGRVIRLEDRDGIILESRRPVD